MNWQPIETAPKDGTFVLIFQPNHDGRPGVIWPGRFDAECDEWWYAEEHWTDATGDPIHPTHWMPIPEPPPRGHIPQPVDVPYLAVGTVLQPLPRPEDGT